MREKERRREEKREKDRKRENNRNREKKREEERKREKRMSRVNYYQSAFNSQKEKLNILAEMLKISKSGADSRYTIINQCHYESSCQS